MEQIRKIVYAKLIVFRGPRVAYAVTCKWGC